MNDGINLCMRNSHINDSARIKYNSARAFLFNPHTSYEGSVVSNLAPLSTRHVSLTIAFENLYEDYLPNFEPTIESTNAYTIIHMHISTHRTHEYTSVHITPVNISTHQYTSVTT